jgi:hypothetical protein
MHNYLEAPVATSRLAKFPAMLATLPVLLFIFTFIFAAAQLAVAQLTIGSGNTATAVPPIPRPSTTPCRVSLFSAYIFDNFNAQSFTYTPPADCPAPWAKVILNASFSISAGIQYDRTANIWIGDTNVYFGTTAEDQPHVGRDWQVERDLTDYSSLFTVSQDGTVDLGNLVNPTYTGVLHGSAELLFFPLAPKQTAPRVADQVIGFSAGPTGGTVGLGSPTSLLEQTLTLPTNITSVFFDVFAQGQSGDEFWYTCVPNNVSTELESCGNTAFRESEVTIDGTPAGVAPIYPWIFTGGIDPALWIPIPGVQTLNFQPYRVNLTPFASLLDDGSPHTIALSVFNTAGYFSATASLLLYLDQNATQLTGAVTENTLAVPVPDITENIDTATNGNLHGTVNTSAGHNFQISRSGSPVQSHEILYTALSGHPLQFWLSPTLYRRDALGDDIDLLQQGVAIVDQDSTGEADQSYPFPGERFADFPALSLEFQLALRSQLFDFRVLRIAPGRRIGVIAARTRNPARGGGLHAERLVRAEIVVLVAKLVEPGLIHLGIV